jgi:hypothetical protein
LASASPEPSDTFLGGASDTQHVAGDPVGSPRHLLLTEAWVQSLEKRILDAATALLRALKLWQEELVDNGTEAVFAAPATTAEESTTTTAA